MNPKQHAKPLTPAVFRSFAGLAACLACWLALPAVPAHAADATWNTQAGNWNAGANWIGGSPGTTSGTTSTDTAWFSALLTGARTVTVDSNRNIRNITFDGGNSSTFGYTLSGGSLLLTSGGTISATGTAGAHTDTISAPMTILGNNATYTISNDSTLVTRLLSITGNITGQSTAGGTTTLVLGGNNPGVNLIGTSNNSISNGTNGGVIGITKEGSTTWQFATLPDDHMRTFSGPIVINAGTLRVGSNSATGRVRQNLGAGVAVTLADVAGATLDFNGNGQSPIGSLAGGGSTGGTVTLGAVTLLTGFNNTNTSFGGSIQGTGGLTKVGTGIQTLSGTNGYTGTTTINGGGGIALDFSAASTASNIISASSPLSLGGGTFRVTGKGSTVNSQTMASTTVGSGANAVALNGNSATSLLLDLKAISRSAGGTLDVTLPTGSPSSTNGVRTSTTNLTNSVLVSAASNGIAYATVGGTDWAGLSSGNIVAMTTYQTGNANYTTANNIDVTNGDTPSSGVTVNTLRFNGNNTLNFSGTNTVNTGGILVTNAATTGATISGGTLRPGSGNELVLINNGAEFTVGSVIANNGANAAALTLSGTGTTILNGLNTYTGATTINNGTVKAGSAQALGLSGSSAVTIANNPNAVLDLNGNSLTIASLNGTRDTIFGAPTAGGSGGTLALGASTLTLGSGAFGGTITGAGGLVKTGAGTLTLSGSSSFTGGITIKSGQVSLSAANGRTPLGTGTVILGDSDGGTNNATLSVTGGPGGTGYGPYAINNNIVLAPTTTGTLTITGGGNGQQTTLNGTVTGANNLVLSGGAGFNYYNYAINNTGNLTVNWGSLDNVGGFNGSVGSNVVNVRLNQNNSSNDVIFAASYNNTGMITAAGSGSKNLTLNGVIGNTTGVTQNSTTSRLILGAANTYTGDTLVQAGTLTLGNNLALQNSGLDTSGAGVINTTSRTTPTFGGLIGSKDITSVITTGYGSVTALTLNPQSGKSYTYSGNIANGAAGMTLTKSGPGTQVLSGSNSYSGATTISAGVLRVDSANALPGGIASTGGASALTINGGVIGLGNGDFARGLGTGTNQVQITGGGGFAAYGADRTVNLGGNGTPSSLTWGTGSFITTAGGTFVLGAADATNMVDFQNPIALGAAVRTVRIDNGSADVDATLSGVLSSVTAGNGLTKTGAGTLSLSAANSFNGTLAVQNGTVRFSSLAAGSSTQNLGAGTLVNLGVAATSAGEIDYRGSGGTLDKNITALGSGRNRIRNSGGGTLTLSGTLTKDGTILELASGTFAVSGRITGASANSDLFVNGAAVTLSNTNNDYNGPTYVYGGGSLTLGASNVIPAASSLILGGTGSDTGTGTFNTGLNIDTVASLTTSSAGATVGISINGATAGGLTTTGNVTFGAGTDTLALSLTSPTLGRYTLLSYASRTGEFDSVTGNGNYNVVYGGTSIDLQHKATIGTITATPASATIIVGGTTSFGFTVQNSAPSLGADLLATVSTGSNVIGSASLGAVAAGATSSSVSGLSFTSNTVGLGQTGSFTLTDAAATNSPQQGSVMVDVLNHSLASFAATDMATKTLNFGTFDNGVWTGGDGGNGTLGYSIFNIASPGFTDAQTAGLDLYDLVFTSGDNIFDLGYSQFQNLASGSSNGFSASVLSPGSLVDGFYTATYTLKFRDQQNLSGAANTRDLQITLSANVIVVPEPGAIALAGIGIAAAAYSYRRRRA